MMDQSSKNSPATIASVQPSRDSVQQTPSRPLGIAYLVGRLESAIRRRIKTSLSPLGVTVSQYTALSVFNARGMLSNAQLAELTMVSPQAANELIKSMEAEGWILRQPDRTHKRIRQISLTDKGKELLAQCDQFIASMEHHMLDEIKDEERALLKHQLRSMIRMLTEL